MRTLTISLPDSLKTFIETEVQQGGYGNVSEFIRSLLRDEQKRREQAKLETMLLRGLDSPASPMTDEDWAELRRRVRERHAQRGGST